MTEINLWENVEGSVTEVSGVTAFRLAVSTGDGRWAQCIYIETRRLEAFPNLYRATLNMMVRDIEARL